MSEFTDYQDLLKIYYNGQMVQDLTNTDNPGLAMLARKKLAGQSMPLPVIETYGQGVSSVFSTAKANQTLTSGKQRLVIRDRSDAAPRGRDEWQLYALALTR